MLAPLSLLTLSRGSEARPHNLKFFLEHPLVDYERHSVWQLYMWPAVFAGAVSLYCDRTHPLYNAIYRYVLVTLTPMHVLPPPSCKPSASLPVWHGLQQPLRMRRIRIGSG